MFHRDVNKGQSGAAQSLIFAENQRQIAADLGVGDGNCGQNFGANVFFDIRARDEADSYIGGYKALQQFAGVEFHGEVRLQATFMKQLLDGIAGMPGLGDDQRKFGDVRNLADFIFPSG